MSDEAAWNMYRHFRWMHNKMTLCDMQGIKNQPDSILPLVFPVFIKPIMNLSGMSVGARTIQNEAEFHDTSMPGHFTMPLLPGPQYSIDVALRNGCICWSYTMLEHRDENGSFTLFERVTPPTEIWMAVDDWCCIHFAGHTGVINLEIIDGIVIESHQRMSPQFIDLYGDGWLEAVVHLYEHKEWDFQSHDLEGYSIPIRVEKQNAVYSFSPESLLQARMLATSVQEFTDPMEYPYNDEHTLRLAVVNSFVLKPAITACNEMVDGLNITFNLSKEEER